jgi:RNA polymerase sigma-32 factor
MARTLHEEPGLRTYVSRVEREPILEREEELELARRYREGDREAGDALVRSHLRSVVKIARRYGGYGIHLSELIGEGTVGLLEALRRFEPERGLRFLTYARYWIRAYILAYVLKHWSIVDMGTTALQSKLFFRLQGEHARLQGELGEGEDVAERLAEAFDTSPERVRSSLTRLSSRDFSLDAPLMQDGATTFLDTLRDEGATQEERVEARERAVLVRDAVARAWPELDERQRLIVRERLLATTEPASLAELGRQLGITRERVRQIESGVKAQLRSELTAMTSLQSGASGELEAAA